MGSLYKYNSIERTPRPDVVMTQIEQLYRRMEALRQHAKFVLSNGDIYAGLKKCSQPRV